MTTSQEENYEVPSEITIYECDECHAYFLTKTSLLSHKKWKHEAELNICKMCNKKFTKNFNLKRHEITCKEQSIGKVKCSLCDFHGTSKIVVLEHYATIHNKVCIEKYVEFSSLEEFKKWKETYETQTKSHFIKTSGSKRLSNGLESCKYVCHRDGYFRSKSKGLRNMKTLGSNKINSYCPAEINVSSDGTIVKVNYIHTHIGHEHDLSRLTLNESEKAIIAQKLALNIPFHQILNDVRNSVTSNELNRIHLLTRKDLWNIVGSFKINHKTVLHKNDCLNVDEQINVSVPNRTQQTVEHSFQCNSEDNSIISEINNKSISFEKKKSALLESILKSFNKIENEKQLQAMAKHIAPVDSIISALSRKQNTSLPDTLSNKPLNKIQSR